MTVYGLEWFRSRATIRTLMDEAHRLYTAGDHSAAAEFMAGYRAWCVANGQPPGNASANIGYCCGYFDPAVGEGMMRFFNVDHPIFGGSFPGPEVAFELGQSWAEKHVKKLRRNEEP